MGYFVIMLLGVAFVIGVLDFIESTGRFEGFWKIRAAAEAVYFSIIAFMCYRIYVKWHDGSFHIDEHDRY